MILKLKVKRSGWG